MTLLKLEALLTVLALVVAFTAPTLGGQWFERCERVFGRIAQRRGLSVLLVLLTSLGLRAVFLPLLPIPEPIVHDEFGYLLAADTYAHGRLTNPTHPMWVHFETFSILQKPSYQCFAQPAQGMILALGKVVFGHPFWGVWLSVGIMCAAITWMLQGWLPPEWALLGGALAILRFGVFGYWANSYWGGAGGAIGGALVLGALPRIKASPQVHDALLMGLGLAILANSRPYEGFVFSLPVAIALFAWIIGRNRPQIQLSWRRVVLPLALVLSLTFAGMGYYEWRVTGSPFRMPYQIERETYAVVPYMLWQHVRPEPVYHHAIIKKMYAEDAAGFRDARSLVGFLAKAVIAWAFFLGPVLTFPLLMLVFVLPRDFSWRNIDRSTSFLLLVLGTLIVGSSLETYYGPHYSAPATGLVLGLVLLSIRQLRQWTASGVFLSRAIPLVCILSFVARAGAAPLRISLNEFYEFAWHQKGAPSFGREAIQKKLQQTPGEHLVLVRYAPEHRLFDEWVYNDADINHSKVVWAREMDGTENDELTDYFKERQVWLLEADETPPRLSRYRNNSLQDRKPADVDAQHSNGGVSQCCASR
jgi:hypothetical protein